jgi:heme exporter protein A
MENILKSIEISVNSATCYKNNSIIFKNASLTLNNGEILLIMGPNGCGKTTFIKSMSSIQNLESGNITFNNIDINDEKSNYIENAIYIGHKNSLNNDLTVKENLEYLCAFDSTANTKTYEKIKKSMEFFDLCKHENHMVSELSEGNKKKTSLARLIITEKKIWLLDEPLSLLDNETIDKVLNLFSKHQKNNGIVVVSSHNDFSDNISNVKIFNIGE